VCVNQAVTTVVGTLCFPIDTVKRRLMVQRKLPTAPSAVPAAPTASAIASAMTGTVPTRAQHVPYRSGWDCLRRILAEEGVRGLFAGLSVNLVRGVTGAILLVAYDDLKKLM
jgi:solute carrier family 25 (adenine nucleotide translocator) protein 4/5/6/31